jgi:hypothetical protein
MSVAFVVPVYPPHYKYITDILPYFKKAGIDLFLIFTNVEEYELFPNKEDIKPIVMPFDSARGGQVVIAIKKYYALMTLIESTYDYFIVIDSEVEVIPEYFTKENILSKINHIFSNKKVFGGKVEPGNFEAKFFGNTVIDGYFFINILKCSASVFKSPDDFRKLRTLTKGFTLYTVWGDIPVYRRDTLKDFFDKIDVRRIEHRDYFDDLMYSNYLVLYHGFSFVNVSERIPDIQTSFVDMIEYTPEEMKIVKDLGFSFSWITGPGYDQHAEFLQEQKTYMKFNVDRPYNHKRTEFNTPLSSSV